MKTQIFPIPVLWLFFLILSASNVFAKSKPKIDPIRFTLTTNATYLSADEEFEIKITAKYLSINPNLVYVFDGSNSFKIKVVMPEGFKQTGGTYSDFVGAELTSSKPSATYTIKGKFTSDTKGGVFQLLRSHKSAGTQSDFIQVGTLAFTTIAAGTDSLSANNARIAVVDPGHIPYMSLSEFRAGLSDSSKVIYLNEGGKSGIFRFEPSNTASVDDSSMVLVTDTRRYLRENLGYLRPEWFGAVVDDGVDDSRAIQKALNKAGTQASTVIRFSPGTYDVTHTMKAVIITPGSYNYRLTIEGAGAGITIIRGSSSFSGNMFEFLNSGVSYQGGNVDNYLIIKDIQFFAGTASRIIYNSQPVGVSIRDNWFTGGEIECLRLGETNQHNFTIELLHNYFAGVKNNGSMNTALVHFISSRFMVIDGNDSDGGKYGFWLDNCDMSFISFNKIEGSKTAAIYISGDTGGEHKITSNHLNPYVGYDADGNFDGDIHGILISGNQGGSLSNNTISNNIINVEGIGVVPLVGIVNARPTGFVLSTGGVNEMVGQTSGAVAVPIGFSDTNKRIILMSATKAFIQGETLIQNGTGATMVLDSLIPTRSYGIKQIGSGASNAIFGNQLRLNPQFGICLTGDGNVVNSNVIEANLPIDLYASTTVVGNKLYATGNNSIRVNSGSVNFMSNTYNKPPLGVSEASYLSQTGGTVSGATTFSGSTNTISNLRAANDITPTSSEGASLGTPSNRFLNVQAISLSGDNIFARTSSGLGIANQGTLIGARFTDNSSLILQAGGTFSDNASTILQVNSSTKGVLLPRMTTSERNAIVSPPEGLEIYNMTTHAKNFYNGTMWKAVVTD